MLEGMAEAIAGLSKSYFGKMSDVSGKRVPFVQAGYGLSALSKPIMGLLIHPVWIFFARTLDRIGKGIRTGARDALLSEEATAATRASIFGFHRSMDTLGAVLGPSLALIFLYYFPGQYRNLFYIAFVPGVAAIMLTGLIKEKKQTGGHFAFGKAANLFAFIGYWKQSPLAYKKLLIGLLAFALFNSADVFLLLQLKHQGIGDTAVIGMYIFYNLIYALASYPIGILADKLGLKNIFLLGLFLFAVVYAGFAMNQQWYMFLFLFFLYGLYAAATEGISKAWISNMVDKKDLATAIGTYSGFQSIAALLASSIAGFIWYKFGPAVMFGCSAIVTIAVMLYLKQIKFDN